MYELKADSRIYVAGHRGMAGSAVLRKLETQGYKNIITATSIELDLRHRDLVFNFIQAKKPEFVILAAAKVGGIMANKL